MTLSDYSQLKNDVVLSVVSRDGHSSLLRSLKELFRGDINSLRRFEQIRTIEQLLQVLELRGVLTEDIVTPLKDIGKEVKDGNLLKRINQYEENHEPRAYMNYYASEKSNKSLPPGGFINTTQMETSIWNKKKDRIFLTVTEQIGSGWRDLARRLKIRECDIEDIDSRYSTMATKASKMLKCFEARADTEKWHFVLCDALDAIRRKELRHSVQEIMMMNI